MAICVSIISAGKEGCNISVFAELIGWLVGGILKKGIAAGPQAVSKIDIIQKIMAPLRTLAVYHKLNSRYYIKPK